MTETPARTHSGTVRFYDTLDSTNEEALRLSRAGERGPLWVVARAQTSGRGRRGREWVSAPGNLFATWLIRAPVAQSAALGFAAGLAAADTVSHFAPQASVQVKWPNDVLLDGRKVSGILLEGNGDALAAGIGINLAHHPAGTEFPATSIATATGRAPDSDFVFQFLAARMGAWYDIWQKDGFTPVRAAWLARAAGLGSAIVARLADGEVLGVFEDLDQDGALLLRANGKLTRITAADVFFGG